MEDSGLKDRIDPRCQVGSLTEFKMPKGVYQRRSGLRRNRKTKAEKTYKEIMAGYKRQRTSIASGNVGGSKAIVTKGMVAPEVKMIDLNFTVAPGTGDWSYFSSALLADIRQGSDANQRLGRQIRVVGIVLRANANTFDAIGIQAGQPFTVDIIQDTQCNGGVPGTTTVYTSPAGRVNLPNANYLHRFRWLMRKDFQSQNGSLTTVNMTKKCNILVQYDNNLGLISDVERNNLIFAFSSGDSTPNFQGQIRLLYTDA